MSSPVKLLFFQHILVAKSLDHEFVIHWEFADPADQLGVAGSGLHPLAPDVGALVIRTGGLRKRKVIINIIERG